MINYNNVIKKILLKEEENLFHGLSFIIVSLIAIHLVVYFNFYKFSSNWIENESKKITFILTNNFDEKEVPLKVKDKINNFLGNNKYIKESRIITENLIKDSLGFQDSNDISSLNLPLIFQVTAQDNDKIDEIYNSLIDISENRMLEKHEHEDQLYEISIIVSRIKLIIFTMFLFVVVLFTFLLMNMVKAALVANFKFIEMLQIMGANSYELAKNISLSIFKKILPGSILALIFIFLSSIILMRIFGTNFNFFDSSYFFQLLISNLVLLLVFFLAFSLLFLILLTTYLFNYFENRFFDKI